jgi:hypothetical protein
MHNLHNNIIRLVKYKLTYEAGISISIIISIKILLVSYDLLV